jgi:hypothetical protein
VAEQPLPPTAVGGFRSEAGVAKDRSPAANIDADCALIGLKEMPITPVDVKHHALEIARGKISGLAVERAGTRCLCRNRCTSRYVSEILTDVGHLYNCSQICDPASKPMTNHKPFMTSLL